jgi:Zn-dependent peptidase ImmA (M78 family)
MPLQRVRKLYIQQLAKDLLRRNDIESPAVDVRGIARNLGIVVVEDDANDEIAGFLIKNYNDSAALIGVNRKHSEARRRFTIAHELGHFFLHEYDGVHFDGKNSGSQMFLRDTRASEGTHIEEREANLFAAELLMPKSLLEKDIDKIVEIAFTDEDPNLKRMAKEYKVSTQALTYRLTNLGYLSL